MSIAQFACACLFAFAWQDLGKLIHRKLYTGLQNSYLWLHRSSNNTLASDLSWKVYVHNQLLTSNRFSLLRDFPSEVTSDTTLRNIWSTSHMSTICIGNPNLVSLVELHSKGLAAFVNNFTAVTDTNYREANAQTVRSCTKYMYHSTVHALHNRLKSLHQKSIDTYTVTLTFGTWTHKKRLTNCSANLSSQTKGWREWKKRWRQALL